MMQQTDTPTQPRRKLPESYQGQIVTAAFEDGIQRPPFCGLENCECPDHEGPAAAAGVYITVRLDEDPPVGLWRVTVTPVRQNGDQS